MNWSRLLGPTAGFLAGFVVAALLHNYPKDMATRHRYCQVCAAYEETYDEGVILGGRIERKLNAGGPVQRMLGVAVGEHEHQFTEWATIFPTFGVPEQGRDVADKIFLIREIEGSPQLISTLYQAIRQDRERATRLIQRLIDPAEKIPTAALNELAREELPWPQRWERAELAAARKK